MAKRKPIWDESLTFSVEFYIYIREMLSGKMLYSALDLNLAQKSYHRACLIKSPRSEGTKTTIAAAARNTVKNRGYHCPYFPSNKIQMSFSEENKNLTFQLEIIGPFVVISAVGLQRWFEAKLGIVEEFGPIKGSGRSLELAMQKIGTKHVGSDSVGGLFFVYARN